MSDERVLAGMNQCEFTGYERAIYWKSFSPYNVVHYLDNNGNVRVVKYDDKIEGKGIAGFILNARGTVLQMYTATDYRRKGIMTGLMALYRHLINNNISFDSNLTEDGKAFYNSLIGL